jgi:adenylosuccinate lyase
VTEPPWGEYQYEIYIAGIGEQKPGLPVSVAELEARAYEAMREESRGYIEGGAGAGDTMRANLEASGGLVFSSQVLLSLVEQGMAREEAYRVVQAAAMRAWERGTAFADELAADGVDVPADAFDPAAFLHRHDVVRSRLEALETR